MSKIKVFSVDDSALIRELLRQIVSSDPNLEMVGTAANPLIAENKILQLQPDVITLDIEMPQMDGITFLKKLMLTNPIPVIMFSSLLEKHRELSLDALNIGAFDYVIKPSSNIKEGIDELSFDLLQKIKLAYANRMKFYKRHGVDISTKAKDTIDTTVKSDFSYEKYSADVILPLVPSRERVPNGKIIVIGSSTGGTEALVTCLENVVTTCPPIVIAQHMPERFTTSFAKRLNSILKIDVRESEDGMSITNGQAVVSCGNKHTLVRVKDGKYFLEVIDGKAVSRHKPSVDVLFRSAAVSARERAIGVILTGMGDDGARGMKEMRDAGAYTIAQNEETCTVFGMPREAIAFGGVIEVLPLEKILGAVLRRV